MPQEKRREWEMLRNFTSQTTIYENVGWADEKVERELIEANSNLSQEEFLKKYPVTVHSEEYYAAIRKGIIKAIIEGDRNSYELTTINPVTAIALNEKGVTMIGDELTQYTTTQIKRLSNANIIEAETLIKEDKASERLTIADFSTERNLLNSVSWNITKPWVSLSLVRQARIMVNYQITYQGYTQPPTSRCGNDQSNLCNYFSIVYFIKGESEKKNLWNQWVAGTATFNWLANPLSWHYYYGYSMLALPTNGPLCYDLAIDNQNITDQGEAYMNTTNNAYWWPGTSTLGVVTAVSFNKNLRPNGNFSVPYPYLGVASVPTGYNPNSIIPYFSAPVNISSLLAKVTCDGTDLGTITN